MFFWVARMVMLSYGMTGKLPFKTVFLHGLVKDEKGRKMSKSLGNVVDPLDVINDQGCDALRFTLATGTAAGQDLNLNMDRLASNRNFTNKIWNAGKFVLFSLEGMSDVEKLALVREGTCWGFPKSRNTVCPYKTDTFFYVSEAEAIGELDKNGIERELPLPSAWIVSKLRQTADHVTQAHDRHDFGEAGRSLYSFFYDDFADWFIESAKWRLYSDDEGEKQLTKAVALHVLTQTLTLLHPFMPYVTEEVWRSLPHRGETLMMCDWPELGLGRDEKAVAEFELAQQIVRAIRYVLGLSQIRRHTVYRPCLSALLVMYVALPVLVMYAVLLQLLHASQVPCGGPITRTPIPHTVHPADSRLTLFFRTHKERPRGVRGGTGDSDSG